MPVRGRCEAGGPFSAGDGSGGGGWGRLLVRLGRPDHLQLQ